MKSYKVRSKHVKFIIETIKKYSEITMKDLLVKIKNKFNNFDITEQWLKHIIRDNNITRKRMRHKHFPKTRYGKKIDKKKEVENFFKIINKYKMKDIISVDETSLRPEMFMAYGRCDLGKRCIKKTSDNIVFKKFTLIVAISHHKLIGYKLYEKGGINTDRYIEFIKENILDVYEDKLIVMDNAKAYDNKKVLKAIKKSDNNYLFGIPYTQNIIP